MSRHTHCFYRFADHTIIDYVEPDTGCAWISGETRDQLAGRYGTLAILPIEEAQALHEASCITVPEPISAETFDEQLNILPPMNWHALGNTECFQSSERYSGRVTSTFVRLGKTYWRWRDIAGLSAAQLVGKARKSAALTGDTP